jgi:hypothetical protein
MAGKIVDIEQYIIRDDISGDIRKTPWEFPEYFTAVKSYDSTIYSASLEFVTLHLTVLSN